MPAITDNTAQLRYEMTFDGKIVFARYRPEGEVVHLLHVEAPPELRGTGAAGRFMQALMEDLRTRGLRVYPVCSYAVSWLRRHPEYHDMIQSAEFPPER